MRFFPARRPMNNCGPSSLPWVHWGMRASAAGPNRRCSSADTTWRECWWSGKFIGGAKDCERIREQPTGADMRRHLAKKGAKTMAAVIALPHPAAVGGTPADITTVIKNTLDARERMYALHAMLIALRRTALDAFLSAFCADLAALTTEPDKAFV